MRVALVLLAVVGCAKSAERPASQEPAKGAGETHATEGNAAAEPDKQLKVEQPKPEVTAVAPPTGGAAPPPPPAPGDGAAPRDRGKGSGIEAARSGGMLGPSDQRAFQVNGKVSIKKVTSKDLDATVKTKLEA